MDLLAEVEHHGEIIRNEKINEFETMVLGATAIGCTQARWHPNHRVGRRRPEPLRSEIGPRRKWPPASLARYAPFVWTGRLRK